MFSNPSLPIITMGDGFGFVFDDVERGDSMRIAICDDENTSRLRLREAITAAGELPFKSEITEFADGASLIDQHEACPFDIIFLDIQMQGKSGIETAQDIREKGSDVIIIFITSFQQFALQSFKIQIFDYIMKPVENDTICEVLGRAVKMHREMHYKAEFKLKDSTVAIEIINIVYMEGSGRSVKVVTKDRWFYCAGKLNEYDSALSTYGFLRCHRDCLVNMRYIQSIEDSLIRTTLGHELRVSARKKYECRRAFNQYLTKYRVRV